HSQRLYLLRDGLFGVCGDAESPLESAPQADPSARAIHGGSMRPAAIFERHMRYPRPTPDILEAAPSEVVRMKRLAPIVFVLALVSASVQAQTPPAGQQPASGQPALGPNTWLIDTSHTAAHFSVRHMMVSTVRGTLGRVTGTVEYDGKTVES